MKIFETLFIILTICFVYSCNSSLIKVPDSPYPISSDSYSLDTIAQGFTIPYGLAIVAENEYLITDRVGKMFHFKDDKLSEINGIPEVVTFGTPGIRAIMHGGLMDISIHPNYSNNRWVYISYLNPEGYSMVSRLKIERDSAVQMEIIFKGRKLDYSGNGMRIVWEDESHFFLNIGNSDYSTYSDPVLFAQDLNHDVGKIHRLMEDGSIPIDNPIFPGQNSPTTIWTYGHRDVQGLVLDTITNTLFGVEHGPKGGDEFNIIEKGQNYGWPLYSEGIHYNGVQASVISKDSAATFTVFPEHYWTVPTNSGGQSIAPACLLKVDGSNISDWNGYFLIGSLAYRRLMKYKRETKETFGLNIEGRIRTIKQLPSGDIIALVERNDLKKSNGFVVRISR